MRIFPLMAVIAGCATAPAAVPPHDDDADRIDRSMSGDAEIPKGVGFAAEPGTAKPGGKKSSRARTSAQSGSMGDEVERGIEGRNGSMADEVMRKLESGHPMSTR